MRRIQEEIGIDEMVQLIRLTTSNISFVTTTAGFKVEQIFEIMKNLDAMRDFIKVG